MLRDLRRVAIETRARKVLVSGAMKSAWSLCLLAGLLGCATSGAESEFDDTTSGGGGSGSGTGGETGLAGTDGGGGDGAGGEGFVGDPTTCAEAMTAKTYMGCEFWPTISANPVRSVFDFVVVVANAGDQMADVTVARGSQTINQIQVPPNELRKITLPWIPELKGPEADECGRSGALTSSVVAGGSAYHLQSNVPVTAYQFNALQYKGNGCADVSCCVCADQNFMFAGYCDSFGQCPLGELVASTSMECFSYSNDASLLLPAATLTGNYRVLASPGNGTTTYIVITATEDGTDVTVAASSTARTLGGGGVAALNPGGQTTFSLQRGDVAQIVASTGADLSGSLVQATKPVQVLSGVPCANFPADKSACDHIEETIFPAETLGTHYVIARPSAPTGGPAPHFVRLYGNFDDTRLEYTGAPPAGAPQVLSAGQVVDLGMVTSDFEVRSINDPALAFGVGMFMVGASELDPTGESNVGDPSLTFASSVEQHRKKYVFLAPDDYAVNYVDVTMPPGTALTLDNASPQVTPATVGSGYVVARIQLGAGNGGAHVLTADKPVGIQVMGYGDNTSYHYPGGLDLARITEPPVIK